MGQEGSRRAEHSRTQRPDSRCCWRLCCSWKGRVAKTGAALLPPLPPMPPLLLLLLLTLALVLLVLALVLLVLELTLTLLRPWAP